MKSRLKTALKEWIPRPIWDGVRGFVVPSIRYAGPYPDWPSACRSAMGYDAEVIVERCLRAALSVRNGDAAYEQDTLLFPKPDLPLAAATALLLTAHEKGSSTLRVFDFGGSLGSLYFRCRPLLRRLGNLRWIVIEQAGLAACGRVHLEDNILSFADSIEAAMAEGGPPSIVIANGVIPYVESPYSTLAALLSLGAPIVYVDRMQFATDDIERIFVQHVPEKIYPASYPTRFMSWSRFATAFEPAYDLVCDFDSFDGRVRSGRHKAQYRGGIWRLRRQGSAVD